jgi:NAD(P)-dependent dehydrogenase (short-subunit alcohol dehydrogenase family)
MADPRPATHPGVPPAALPAALQPGRVAVVTGAASGIGLAAAQRFFELGLKVVLADRDAAALERAAGRLTAAAPARAAEVLGVPTDVARAEALQALRDTVRQRYGAVAVLMNNAGAGLNPGRPWENLEGWKALLEVNLWGAIHGVQAFVPDMLSGGEPALIINTGSKQGITSPPGNPAYNLSKAALKSYTESLAHALRELADERIRAHLLIPGFTFTGMTGARRAAPAAAAAASSVASPSSAPARTTPPGAWTPAQVVEFMLQRVCAGDFYILCPDNEVDRATDEARIRWAADDIILNRPALSRWHPDYREAFARYMAGIGTLNPR